MVRVLASHQSGLGSFAVQKLIFHLFIVSIVMPIVVVHLNMGLSYCSYPVSCSLTSLWITKIHACHVYTWYSRRFN